VQREAAEKFAGAPQETLFSLLHKPYFEFSVPRRLRRSDFEPRPRVATVLLHARRRERPLLSTSERREYERFVRATFGSGPQAVGMALRARFTRRQIVRLARDLRFSPWQRASELTFPQWLALFRFAAQTRVGPHPLAPLHRRGEGEGWAAAVPNSGRTRATALPAWRRRTYNDAL
jgi:23S rRNA (adenine-N6)-dimethyltransferase